jgi:hypothetical protein
MLVQTDLGIRDSTVESILISGYSVILDTTRSMLPRALVLPFVPMVRDACMSFGRQ